MEECRILEVWVEVDDSAGVKVRVARYYWVAVFAFAAHIHLLMTAVEAVGWCIDDFGASALAPRYTAVAGRVTRGRDRRLLQCIFRGISATCLVLLHALGLEKPNRHFQDRGRSCEVWSVELRIAVSQGGMEMLGSTNVS